MYKRDVHLPNKPSLGIEGAIRFYPNPDICEPCATRIRLSQTVRLLVFQNNSWISYQFQAVGPERNKWRTAEDAASKVQSGYHIDVLPSCKKSIFYRDCTPNKKDSQEGSYTGRGAPSVASLADYPGFPWAANPKAMTYLFQFETCAICEDNMTVYGCVHWGFKSANGVITYNPQKPIGTEEMSPTFNEAIRIYNEMR